MFEIDAVFTENVGGSLETSAHSLDFNIRSHVEDSMNKLAETIQKNYASVPYYTTPWVLRKAREGYPVTPLHYTEALFSDVLKVRADMHHAEGPKGEHVVNIDGFKNSSYVAISEQGSDTEPARPFIIPAIEEWGGEVRFEAEAIAQGTAAITEKGLGPSTSTSITRGMTIVPKWAFWLLPASSLFLYMGMYSDIVSSLHGSFLSPGAARSWVVAYFQGRTFVTKKKIRRIVRREIWRR